MKYAVGASTLLAVVSVVHEGGRWSGFDPKLQYGGHTVNVWVEWPETNTCEISGAIKTDINAHDATLISESSESFGCPAGATTIETKTLIKESTLVKGSGKKGQLKAAAVMVPASGDFPVHVVTYLDGVQKGSCPGRSNALFDCAAVHVSK